MPSKNQTSDTLGKSIQAGLLTWLIPGLGHWILGHRGLATVFFVAISFPYFTGLALGGVMDSGSPAANKWLFLAELGIGGYTAPSYLVSQQVQSHVRGLEAQGKHVDLTDYRAYYPESDVAQIYLATAGLLNLLAILDAIARAQTGGLPTFVSELRRAEQGQTEAPPEADS